MPNPTGGSSALLLLPLLLVGVSLSVQTSSTTTSTTTTAPTTNASATARTRALRQTAVHYNDNSLLVEHLEQSPMGNGGSSASTGDYYRGPTSMTTNDFGSSSAGGGGGSIERNGTDNRKPAFRNCASLVASVREEEPAGVFVTRVQANDPDEDRIEYSFVNAMSERPKFRIDAHTGNIYTVYQFDRDEPAREKEVSWWGRNAQD